MLEMLEVNTLTRDIYNGLLGLTYTRVTSVLQPDEKAAKQTTPQPTRLEILIT